MKTLKDLLLIGDPQLHEVAEPIYASELPLLNDWVADLHNVMEEIRAKYHFGRGIAAPQIGIKKRLIYLNVDKPMIIINPEYTFKSDKMFESWDDCMCFPDLFVKVLRHRQVTISYYDETWQQKEWFARDDMAELIQHEYDHLDGILATEKAIDPKSFRWRSIERV